MGKHNMFANSRLVLLCTLSTREDDTRTLPGQALYRRKQFT